MTASHLWFPGPNYHEPRSQFSRGVWPSSNATKGGPEAGEESKTQAQSGVRKQILSYQIQRKLGGKVWITRSQRPSYWIQGKIQKPKPRDNEHGQETRSTEACQDIFSWNCWLGQESVATVETQWVGCSPSNQSKSSDSVQLESWAGLGQPVKAPSKCGPLGN